MRTFSDDPRLPRPRRREVLQGGLALGGAFLFGAARRESGFEVLRPDYGNLRGLNYIASYAPSPVAMWRFYDAQVIDRELGLMAALGANAIRVWLAWIVWEVEGDGHLANLRDFATRCERHGLHLMPVLWDSRFGDDYATYDAVEDWVANPGRKHLANPEFVARADPYVDAVVGALADQPALLLWDVMNEPNGPLQHAWTRRYGARVAELDPDHGTTVGFALAEDNVHAADWVDVLSYHPYGVFEETRKRFTDQIRQLAEKHGKPFFASEAGAPRWGQPYEECLAFFEREKVGVFLFEAMVGSNRFNLVTGFLYPDGTVPSRGAVDAFQGLARRQGRTVPHGFESKATDRDFPYAGEREVAELVFGWDESNRYPKPQAYLLLGWAIISLAWTDALGSRVAEVQALQLRSKEAFDAGETEELERVSSKLARIAAEALAAKGFACADGLELPPAPQTHGNGQSQRKG